VTVADRKIPLTIREGFSVLANRLANVGFQVESLSAGPISSSQLDGVRVLVLPPSPGVLSPSEENTIVDYVRNGGGLLLLGEGSYDGHTNLAKKFGITPIAAVVCDPVYSISVRLFHPRIWNLTSHEITTGVQSYLFDAGQPLIVKSPAFPLARAGNESWFETDWNGVREPGEGAGDIIVLAASEYGSGRVVVNGDATSFANYDVVGYIGLDLFDTWRLALNIFNWLGRQKLFGVNLSYSVSISQGSAQNHSVHVRLVVDHVYTSVLTLTMYRWYDGQYYQWPVTGVAAFDIAGANLPVEFRTETIPIDGSKQLRRFWVVQVAQVSSFVFEYSVTLNFVRTDWGTYMGYLCQRFGISQGAGVFILPSEVPIADIRVSFSLPQRWGIYTLWKKLDNVTFLPENIKSFMWSTFAVGPFTEFTRKIGDTNVRIATYGGWDESTRNSLAEYSFRMYDYMTRLFGRSVPLETYLAVWVPNADDGKHVAGLEWSDSQGLCTDPPPNVSYVEYAHRVFHTWNAFPPTGMNIKSLEELWFVEGTNYYYDHGKALDQLGIKSDYMANFLRTYLTEYVGTEFDVPIAYAYRYGNWTSFNKYNWLYYNKGALVSFLLDETIIRITNGVRSLDDLLKIAYARYGGCKGAVGNTDLIQILNTFSTFNFTEFFDRYIYGTKKLPLRIDGNRLIIDWLDIGPLYFSIGNSGGITAMQGGLDSNTITVTILSGPTQEVSVSAFGLPSGCSATFNPSSGKPTFNCTCTITTSSATPIGSYTITVTGTSGGLTRTTTFTLTVKLTVTRIVLDASPKPGYVNKPVTISGTLYGSWRCIRDGMVVGKPVEIKTGWGFSTVVATDYYGRFSVTTNCPSTGGAYNVTATFYEDQDLAGSSTTISYDVIAKIPTTLTISYVGNREFGGYLRRADTGAYLVYKPVKLTVTYLSGTTWQTTTYDLQTRQDGYWNLEFLFYWNSATVTFEGDETYAPSSATVTR